MEMYYMFDYPLKLHHTQTKSSAGRGLPQFDYPLKLHHTQTSRRIQETFLTFDYPLKLHHTQTSNQSIFTHHTHQFKGQNAIIFIL